MCIQNIITILCIDPKLLPRLKFVDWRTDRQTQKQYTPNHSIRAHKKVNLVHFSSRNLVLYLAFPCVHILRFRPIMTLSTDLYNYVLTVPITHLYFFRMSVNGILTPIPSSIVSRFTSVPISTAFSVAQICFLKYTLSIVFRAKQFWNHTDFFKSMIRLSWTFAVIRVDCLKKFKSFLSNQNYTFSWQDHR